MHPHRIPVLATALFALLTWPASAAVITIQSLSLPPDSIGHIHVLVEGPEMISGFSLGVMIADGGPDLGGTATHPPVPWFIDAMSPLFFSLFPTPEPWPVLPNFYVGLDVVGSTVSPRPAMGSLMVITVDTGGALPGIYPLTFLEPVELFGAEPGSTVLVGGNLVITPEPATLGTLALGALAGLRRSPVWPVRA